MTDKAGARRPIELDLERFERLAKNLAALLNDLIKEANAVASRSEARRKKVFVDLRASRNRERR